MIDDPRESLCADRPFSYFLMSVLMAAQRILIIIQMDSFQSFQSDSLIKLFQNAVQIIHDVIAAVIHMTGIQTDTDMIFLSTREIISASSSNVRPTSVPFPAIVSKSTVVFRPS